MTVFQVDPLRDPRWARLVERHLDASVFHTPGWIRALERTYGFEPLALTTSPPAAELRNGMLFCEVRSWLTGRRLVSLPFSDHCDPLVEDEKEGAKICTWLEAERHRRGWRYIELRPRRTARAMETGFRASEEYWVHSLDLRPGPHKVFQAFHKDSVQRKIRRAGREGLVEEEGRGEELLATFHRLLVLTRQRHRLPPQPLEWFRNLTVCLGSAVTVRVVSQCGRPIAGVLTLRHRDTMVYKYGASDAAFHRLGGMQLLFWRTIQAACEQGCQELDLGRSEPVHAGLLRFKDRLGAMREPVSYWRSPGAGAAEGRIQRYVTSGARHALGHLPDRCRVAAGRILYRHAG